MRDLVGLHCGKIYQAEVINRRAAKRLGIDAGFGKIRKDIVRRVRVYKDQGGESVNDELIRVEVHGYKPNLTNGQKPSSRNM